jgi:2-polyprenyl-3-methyl-5-hydroxy-6-metoxy-1,4-benzoquinol methylase
VHGLEFSAAGRRSARDRFGTDLSDELLERGSDRGARFDVVCAFYLVEHLPDPRTFLRQAARALKPGGLLFLRCPHTTPLVRVPTPSGFLTISTMPLGTCRTSRPP